MAGHSKWSQIKRKKAKTDQQKGKVFSRITREIIIAVKMAGSDPNMNARLRLAIQKAKESNMPNDNIKRAIERGAKSSADDSMEEVVFEAYAQAGVAMLIETVTDNRNRTVPNLRTALSKKGASLASKGAVSYLFEKKGLFIFPPETIEDQIVETALNFDVDDVTVLPDTSIEVVVNPDQFESLLNAFQDANLTYAEATLSLMPTTSIEVEDKDIVRKILDLIEVLEEDDDVQQVHTNMVCEKILKFKDTRKNIFFTIT